MPSAQDPLSKPALKLIYQWTEIISKIISKVKAESKRKIIIRTKTELKWNWLVRIDLLSEGYY